MSWCRTYRMPCRHNRSATGFGPGDRSGQGGSNGSIITHKSSSTIHGRVVTPRWGAEFYTWKDFSHGRVRESMARLHPCHRQKGYGVYNLTRPWDGGCPAFRRQSQVAARWCGQVALSGAGCWWFAAQEARMRNASWEGVPGSAVSTTSCCSASTLAVRVSQSRVSSPATGWW